MLMFIRKLCIAVIMIVLSLAAFDSAVPNAAYASAIQNGCPASSTGSTNWISTKHAAWSYSYSAKLYSSASAGSTVLANVGMGTQVRVLSGATCGKNNQWWWQVSLSNGTSGWMYEIEGLESPCARAEHCTDPLSKQFQAVSGNCPGNMKSQLFVGGRGRVTFGGGPTSLRTLPQAADIVYRMPEGTEFNVTGGPVCGILHNTWWQVQLDDNRIGWAPEGSADGRDYWLELVEAQTKVTTGTACTENVPPQPRLTIGMQAMRVADSRFGEGRVRSGAGQNFPIVRSARFGEVFSIIGGPKKIAASLWWQVEFDDGFTGWMMEGFCEPDGLDYYIEPVENARG
jgi:hypothetical protein